MEVWIIVIGIVILAVADHVGGVILGPWWKRWIIKIAGVPKVAMKFVAALLKALAPDAEGKINVTAKEWDGLEEILEELKGQLEPPK